MANFAEADFDFANYAQSRPDIMFGRPAWDQILQSHEKYGGGHGLAVDLGCGPAKQAPILATLFDETMHIDASHFMVDVAAKQWQDVRTRNGTLPRFITGSATDLSFIENRSVDLVISGNAAAYFQPFSKWWAEMQRVLKPGGTVAFWFSHSAFSIVYPSLNGIVEKIMNDERLKAYSPFQTDHCTDLRTILSSLPSPGTDGAAFWQSRAEIDAADGVHVDLWDPAERYEWVSAHPAKQAAIEDGFNKTDFHNMLCSISAYDRYLKKQEVKKKSKEDFGWQSIAEKWPSELGDNEKVPFRIPVWLSVVKRLPE